MASQEVIEVFEEFKKCMLVGLGEVVSAPLQSFGNMYSVVIGTDEFLTFKKGSEFHAIFGSNYLLNEGPAQDLFDLACLLHCKQAKERLSLERLQGGDYAIKWDNNDTSTGTN